MPMPRGHLLGSIIAVVHSVPGVLISCRPWQPLLVTVMKEVSLGLCVAGSYGGCYSAVLYFTMPLRYWSHQRRRPNTNMEGLAQEGQSHPQKTRPTRRNSVWMRARAWLWCNQRKPNCLPLEQNRLNRQTCSSVDCCAYAELSVCIFDCCCNLSERILKFMETCIIGNSMLKIFCTTVNVKLYLKISLR